MQGEDGASELILRKRPGVAAKERCQPLRTGSAAYINLDILPPYAEYSVQAN